jgi:hypothetical protein
VSASRIAKWNGSSWSEVGGGTDKAIYTLVVHDDGTGSALYAGGIFTTAGASAASRVARWNGSAWSALGSGISEWVYALEVFDNGSGADLYAGGRFLLAGGTSANGLAVWDGSTWAEVGGAGGAQRLVTALTVFDDGSGDALHVAGTFTTLGGVSAENIAKWDGATWSALGSGLNGSTLALQVFNDGAGTALYAGGSFNTAGGASANHIARWNGTSWSALGSGVDHFAYALDVFDDGSDGASDLYSGGTAGAVSLAVWRGCEPGTAYCFGDGLDPIVTAQCPCTNFGDPGHGCANSNAALGGARLYATGTTSPNTVLFRCTSVPNNTLCAFFQTVTDVPAGFVFGDGVRCVNTPLIRFGQQSSGQNGNPANTAEAAPIVTPYGFTRHYQCQYRNPAPAFCSPATFNMSNAYSIAW